MSKATNITYSIFSKDNFFVLLPPPKATPSLLL